MARWEEEWIATAERLVRDEFTNSYMNIEANNDIGIVETISEKETGTKVCMLIISLWLMANTLNYLPRTSTCLTTFLLSPLPKLLT